MSKKLRIAIFKLIDIVVIFTMVFASPMSMTASALAQDSGPALITDESDYETGDSARVTGSGFTPGDYVLAAQGPDGTSDWGTASADANGVFVSNSPAGLCGKLRSARLLLWLGWRLGRDPGLKRRLYCDRAACTYRTSDGATHC